MAAEDNSLKYRAPALEKGLDVMELLAAEKVPLTLNQISQALGRSVSELFRMVQVLEHRGYVATASNGFRLTGKLFALGMTTAPTHDLLGAALPIMRDLSQAIGQACHVAVASEDQIVVVARIEAPGDLGFSVRVGYRRALADSTSGLVILAFQPPAALETWKTKLGKTAGWEEIRARIDTTRRDGFLRQDSSAVAGVVDLSAPILVDGVALGALTVPYVSTQFARPIDETIEAIKAAASEIGDLMGCARV